MTTKERLFANRQIYEPTGCWLWTGALNEKGYGIISINGKSEGVHRVSYKEFIGEIKNQVLHKIPCFFKHCFFPDHLYDGTAQNNVNDSMIVGTHSYAKKILDSNCHLGHPYDKVNSRGERICSTCMKIAKSKYNKTSKGIESTKIYNKKYHAKEKELNEIIQNLIENNKK